MRKVFASLIFFAFCLPQSQLHAAPVPALTITVDAQKEHITAADLAAWETRTPTLTFDTGYTSSVENASFCPDHRQPCFLRLSIRERAHIRKIEHATINPERVKNFVATLAQKLSQPPVDATLSVSGEDITIATPHRNGHEIDVDKSTEMIFAALTEGAPTVALNSEVSYAKIRSDNLAELGLTELLGEGRSNFSGSPVNRRFNIAVSASRYENLLLAPGEEFSFVEHLGPVDGEHGFKKELVIVDNETRPEYGGGVCQVSTTVFRAAILTGMEITQRKNHSYPVKYYEPVGFDATIYIPAPDIRFKNNTTHHILIVPKIEGDEMVVRFYGTKDGRTVNMVGPVITEKNTDGSMKTYFTQTVTDSQGNVMIDDTFYSNYKSPKDYPHPGDVSQQDLTTKPSDWSKKQWDEYQNANTN